MQWDGAVWYVDHKCCLDVALFLFILFLFLRSFFHSVACSHSLRSITIAAKLPTLVSRARRMTTTRARHAGAPSATRAGERRRCHWQAALAIHCDFFRFSLPLCLSVLGSLTVRAYGRTVIVVWEESGRIRFWHCVVGAVDATNPI